MQTMQTIKVVLNSVAVSSWHSPGTGRRWLGAEELAILLALQHIFQSLHVRFHRLTENSDLEGLHKDQQIQL